MSIRCDVYSREDWDIWFAAAPYGSLSYPSKTLKQWAAEEHADMVYNLCLFNMTGSGSDRYGAIKGRTAVMRLLNCGRKWWRSFWLRRIAMRFGN